MGKDNVSQLSGQQEFLLKTRYIKSLSLEFTYLIVTFRVSWKMPKENTPGPDLG